MFEHAAAHTQRPGRLVHLHAAQLRPHTLRHELRRVSTWWIVSHCRHCVVLLTEWCCFKLCPVPCWLRPGYGVVSACVVLFQAQCGVVEGIVLSFRGYCLRVMYVCLFMLQASLSGRRQFHATGSSRSHSRSPLTSALLLQSRAEVCVCVCVWVCECECVCVSVVKTQWERLCVYVGDWHAMFVKTPQGGLLHSVYLG